MDLASLGLDRNLYKDQGDNPSYVNYEYQQFLNANGQGQTGVVNTSNPLGQGPGAPGTIVSDAIVRSSPTANRIELDPDDTLKVYGSASTRPDGLAILIKGYTVSGEGPIGITIYEGQISAPIGIIEDITSVQVTSGAYTALFSGPGAGFNIVGGTASQFLKADGSLDNNTYVTSGTILGYIPYIGATNDVDLGAHSLKAFTLSVLGGTSSEFLKADGSLDSSVYLTTNQTITLSGEASGIGATSIAVTLLNSAVIGKVLTGYASGAGTITSADSILTAIQKLNGNTAALVTGVSSVTNSDGTLTISPTTGVVVASLNLSHANTWAAIQTYNGVPINEAQGGTLASASTVNIGAATGNYLTISGSVTITAFDTIQAGTRRVVTFTGTPILTNSSALVLPWGNITVVAGDSATFVSTGGGNWICTQYQRSTSTGSGAVVFAASPTFTGTTTIGALTTNSASTQSIGGVTINIGGNTTTTTANILGGATVNTAVSTVNLNTGAAASGSTKNTNIATGALAGATNNITVGSLAATTTITLNGNTTWGDAVNLSFGTTTGSKIGTSASQKIGFWNATPIVQPTTAIAAASFVANTSGISNDSATWDGYTIGQIVKALRNAGLLA